MEPPKVILYYGFTPLGDLEAVRLWQRELCERLELKGRILLSTHGINGTLGGGLGALKTYVNRTKEYAGFKHIDFKWSEGTGSDFPRLRVRVREEIVTFGAPGKSRLVTLRSPGGAKGRVSTCSASTLPASARSPALSVAP